MTILDHMEAKIALKRKALSLRKKGLSYNEIRKHVPVAKSSLSLWLKHIPLSEEHRGRLYTKQVEFLSHGMASQKERRKKQIESIVLEARKEISTPLSPETYRLLGAALYWAEGSKTNGFEITNSDPVLILFMVDWFEKVFQIPRTSLRVSMNIYRQQNEPDLKKFWSEITGIPLQNFGKAFVKPENKGYKKNNLYYGTVKVRVPKGTDMRIQVFGWIQSALQEFSPTIESAQLRWSHLREVQRPPVNLRP
jgi:hypothetical protein